MLTKANVELLTNAGGKPLAYDYGSGVTVPDSASKEELAYAAFALRRDLLAAREDAEQLAEALRGYEYLGDREVLAALAAHAALGGGDA